MWMVAISLSGDLATDSAKYSYFKMARKVAQMVRCLSHVSCLIIYMGCHSTDMSGCPYHVVSRHYGFPSPELRMHGHNTNLKFAHYRSVMNV